MKKKNVGNGKLIISLEKIVYNPFFGPLMGFIGVLLVLFTFTYCILLPQGLRESIVKKVVIYDESIGFKPIAFNRIRHEIIFENQQIKSNFIIKYFVYSPDFNKNMIAFVSRNKNGCSELNGFIDEVVFSTKVIISNETFYIIKYRRGNDNDLRLAILSIKVDKSKQKIALIKMKLLSEKQINNKYLLFVHSFNFR